jgi:hypothetical protein
MRITERAYFNLALPEIIHAIILRLSIIIGIIYSRIEDERKDAMFRHRIANTYTFHQVKPSAVNKEVLRDHINMWKPLESRIDTKWLQTYIHISNIESPKFVPGNIYYRIVEPCLNYDPMLKAFSDKNLYETSAVKDYVPKTLLRKIYGVYYDRFYNPVIGENHLNSVISDYQEVIVKPTLDSWGGKSVDLFQRDGSGFVNQHGEALTVQYLDRVYGENYIVQEKIVEHETLRMYNPSSVNTVRIYTYRSVSNEEVIPLAAVLRVGKPTSLVDNWSSGGFSVGLNPTNGVLKNFAVDKKTNKYECIGDIDLTQPHQILFFNDMVNVATKVARAHVYARVLGFDLAVDTNANVRILEVNNKSMGINFHQMTTGPLFREYTEEVITFCMKNRANGKASIPSGRLSTPPDRLIPARSPDQSP